jgi:hypothetical protein
LNPVPWDARNRQLDLNQTPQLDSFRTRKPIVYDSRSDVVRRMHLPLATGLSDSSIQRLISGGEFRARCD